MGRRDEMSQFQIDCDNQSLFKTIGKNIEECRKDRKNPRRHRITQEEIATELRKKIGVSYDHSSISKKISGDQKFSISELLVISNLLGRSLEQLCGIKEKPRDNEAAERYTGLSQESVRYLHSLDKKKRAVLDSILNRDSGLDSILQDICDAQSAARNAALIEKHLQLVMLQHDGSSKGGYQTKRSFSIDHTMKEETIYVPPSTEEQLNRQRTDILNRTDMLQLQEYRQENHKRNIRTMFERILSNLIPSAKSDLFPDLDKIREKYAGSGSNPFLR